MSKKSHKHRTPAGRTAPKPPAQQSPQTPHRARNRVLWAVAVAGGLVALYSAAVLAGIDDSSTDSGCYPRTAAEATIPAYPGATWIAGKFCGVFLSGSEIHLYVSADEPSKVIAYYDAALSAWAIDEGGEVEHTGDYSVTARVQGDGSFSEVRVEVSTQAPEGWNAPSSSKTYILVKERGGLN